MEVVVEIRKVEELKEATKAVVERSISFGTNDENLQYTLMRTRDGSIFVGGKHKNLFKLDKDLKMIVKIDVGDSVRRGIVINDLVVCAMFETKKLKVFDSSLKLVHEIHLK